MESQDPASSSSSTNAQDRTTEFLGLLTRHERQLAAYVFALIQPVADAEDILQQTKMILWKHFGEFELGTNFLAWARKTAFHQILTYRRKVKRQHLSLDDAALEALSHAVGELAEEPSARHEALRKCVGRLPEAQRQMVQLRYFEEMEIDAIAARLERTEAAVYRALSRIRMGLMSCVEDQISRGTVS